jgi:MoxR-vWA-beta-propeller ternary system domain bpX4
MTPFVDFLRRLLTEGTAVLRARPEVRRGDAREAGELLAGAYADYRLEVAGPPIAFDVRAALDAAERLWLACWFLLERGEDPAEVERRLTPMEPPASAAQHLSADLVLRFAPQVYRRARRVDAADLLTKWLERLLRQHPLTGVLSEVEEGPLAAVTLGGHPGLLLLYAERLADNVRPAWVPEGPALPYVEMVFAERGLPLPGPV